MGKIAWVMLAFLVSLTEALAGCERAEELFNRAVSAGVTPQQRVELLEQSVKECDSFAAYYELGKAHHHNGAPLEAVSCLKRALRRAESDDEKAALLWVTARVYLDMDRLHDAVLCYKTSLKRRRNREVERELLSVEKGLMSTASYADQMDSALETARSLGVVPFIDVRVPFPFDSYRLTDEGRKHVLRIAEVMKRLGDTRFTLVGHTDSRGPMEYNDALSRKRADAVRACLVGELGIDPGRLAVDGMGERELLYHDDTELAHSLNRRVEVIVEGTL